MFKFLKSTNQKVCDKPYLKAGLSLVCLSLSLQANSADNKAWSDNFRLNGFLSQAFVLTDENNYLGSSEDGSFRYNSAGISASYRTDYNVQFAAQGVYKQIGKVKPRGSRIDYAIADWRAYSDIENAFGIRAGRLKNPYGFYNETRDIAATRPSVLLPESIYVDYLQEAFHSSDSLGIYGHKDFTEGTLSFSTVYGQPIINNHTLEALLSVNATGDLDQPRILLNRINYEDSAGRYRLSLSGGNLKGDYQSGLNDAVIVQDGFGGTIALPINNGKLEILQWLASAEIFVERWNIVGEFQRRDVQVDDIFTNIPLLGSSVVEKSMSYYLQIGYQLKPNLNFYVRRDHAYRFKNDKDGEKFARDFAATGAIAHNTYAKDLTVGVNYKPTPNIDLGAEVHMIEGTFWLPDLENPAGFYPDKHWNMFLIQAAYRF